MLGAASPRCPTKQVAVSDILSFIRVFIAERKPCSTDILSPTEAALARRSGGCAITCLSEHEARTERNCSTTVRIELVNHRYSSYNGEFVCRSRRRSK